MRHHSKLPGRRLAWLFALVAMLAAAAIPAAAQAGGSTNDPPKVMTRNLYLGADLSPALTAIGTCPYVDAATCQNLVLSANLTIWNQVQATNFPARAKVLAKEIDDDDPYMVGLQEVALWRSGSINGVKDATTVDYDFLSSLLNELSARGNRYRAAVVQQEADIESPAADGKDHRLTMRDVILVRTDLPSGRVSFSNPQSGNYANFISVPAPGSCPPSCYGSVEFKRGWTAIDVKIHNKPAARFVNTHLESFATGVRFQQASELVGPTGPLTTGLPAILVGDLNSDPDIPFGGDPASGASDALAFSAIAGAGFVDSGNTAKTFGHNADLNDFPSNPFTERIDHVMTRGADFGPLSNKVVGTDPANRTPGGLWPSDHGGLIVGLG